MRRRSSETADKWRPLAEKRCNATKVNVPRSRITSSTDGMAARWTLTAIYKESVDAMCPSNCYVRRESSAPPRVDASINPWRVIQGVNTPSVQSGSKGGVQKAHIFDKRKDGGGAEMILPSKDSATG